MDITEATYFTVDDTNTCIQSTIDGVVMSVPLDPNNRHYQAILEWVAEGNTIQEAD
jgi:hypothetical protein